MTGWRKYLIPDVGRKNELGREQWLKDKLGSLAANSRILDAGAGTQRYRAACGHLRYVSQDFAAYDGRGDEAGLYPGGFCYGQLDIVSDITAIPEPNSSFDAIMCVEVLEHLPSPVEAIREFARLLRPGGDLFLTAPFCSITHFSPYHFCTGFNRHWYMRHLPEHGFNIVEIVPNGNYFEYVAQELYRLPYIARRYANCRSSLFGYLGMYIVLVMLSRFSRRDRGSAELLCYGYHVHARKNS